MAKKKGGKKKPAEKKEPELDDTEVIIKHYLDGEIDWVVMKARLRALHGDLTVDREFIDRHIAKFSEDHPELV